MRLGPAEPALASPAPAGLCSVQHFPTGLLLAGVASRCPWPLLVLQSCLSQVPSAEPAHTPLTLTRNAGLEWGRALRYAALHCRRFAPATPPPSGLRMPILHREPHLQAQAQAQAQRSSLHGGLLAYDSRHLHAHTEVDVSISWPEYPHGLLQPSFLHADAGLLCSSKFRSEFSQPKDSAGSAGQPARSHSSAAGHPICRLCNVNSSSRSRSSSSSSSSNSNNCLPDLAILACLPAFQPAPPAGPKSCRSNLARRAESLRR